MTGALELTAARAGKAADGRTRCFEDFDAGQVFMLGRREVCRAEIIGFARQYDPQPFHVDEQAAQDTLLEGLAASGWHTCAMVMRMLCDGLFSKSRYAGLLGIEELKWLMPVRPGDALAVRATCLGSRSTLARPELGIVELRCEVFNGSGRRVMWWHAQAALERRGGTKHPDTDAACPRQAVSVRRRPAEHALKYFEDVGVGEEIALGQHRFSAEEIAAFSRVYDPLRPHPEAVCEWRSASGWHVAATWMRRLVDYYEREAEMLRGGGSPAPQLGPSPGIRSIRWHRPVDAGDTLTFTTWVERKLELPARCGWGMIIGGAEGFNQRGEIVISFFAQLLLERRDRARRLAPFGS